MRGVHIRWRRYVIALLFCFGLFGTLTQVSRAEQVASRRPNFVIIFTDDQGYGDLSCFGGTHVSTPAIDRMAAEGAKLTSFYVAAAVCSPSRAALLTGCYPRRIDMSRGSNFGVLLAADSKGLHPDEITIAEVLKEAGYATGIFGKWHQGDQPEFLPTRQGFDEYFGIPYSHDIHPYHPHRHLPIYQFPPLPLLDGEKVIEADPDADYLTKRITDRSVRFIESNKDRPFFLYVPHPIPHSPLHVSPPFMKDVPQDVKDKLAEEDDSIDYGTRSRLFRQAISEIDWSVDQIMQALRKHGLDRDTFVLFTSDNGPARGSAGPLRGRKGSSFEGGMREPTVVWWPGKIPAGTTNDELMTAMDLMPTLAKLAGVEVPTDRVIDGKDIWPVLSEEPGAKSPHDRFFYCGGKTVRAIRSGPWKLHVESTDWTTKTTEKMTLYNLDKDIGERHDVAAEHPEIVNRLMGYAKEFEEDLAANSRPAGFVENPKPLVPYEKKAE